MTNVHILTDSDRIEHSGVRGMKWGVRKSEPSMGTRKGRRALLDTKKYESLTVQTKNGVSVTMTECKSPAFTKFVASLTKSGTKFNMNSHDFKFHVGGKKVGNGSFEKKSKDEIYLNWIGIDPPHRGKGYASAVFDAAIAYGREQGASKFTLEVPGKSPDARHIYEKRGFVVTKEATASQSADLWGGLTEMELDLRTLKHMDAEDLEFEAALEQTFPPMPKEVYDQMENESTLTHSGVLGMKWGHRKSRPAQKRSTTGRMKFRGNSEIKDMSNEELKNRVNRLNMEQQYKRLNSSVSQNGKKIVLGILIGSTTAVGSKYAQKGIETGISFIGNLIKNR